MKKRTLIYVIFGCLFAFLTASCTNVMSTSWGSWARRAAKIPDVNTGNVDSLVDEARGNPDFARALLEKIRDQINETPAGPDKTALQDAGVAAAAEASGLGGSVLANVGDLLADLDNDDKADTEIHAAVQEVFSGIYEDSNKDNLQSIAGDLVTVINSDSEAYKATSQASMDDLLMATVTLILAEAQSQGYQGGDIITFFTTSNFKEDPVYLTGHPFIAAALDLVEIMGRRFSGNDIVDDLLGSLGM
jgi:hypothetical protein